MHTFEWRTGRSRKLLSNPRALNILARRNFLPGTPVRVKLDISKERTYEPGLQRRVYGYILQNLKDARKVDAQGVVVVQEVDYAVLLLGHGPQSFAEGREIYENEVPDRLVGFPYTELRRIDPKD